MSGPGFSVHTKKMGGIAADFEKIGEHLDGEAKRMRSLETPPGSNAVFGIQLDESVILGGKYNDLVNMLAAYGEMLGETLKLWSLQLTASGNAYAETDQATAERLGKFGV